MSKLIHYQESGWFPYPPKNKIDVSNFLAVNPMTASQMAKMLWRYKGVEMTVSNSTSTVNACNFEDDIAATESVYAGGFLPQDRPPFTNDDGPAYKAAERTGPIPNDLYIKIALPNEFDNEGVGYSEFYNGSTTDPSNSVGYGLAFAPGEFWDRGWIAARAVEVDYIEVLTHRYVNAVYAVPAGTTASLVTISGIPMVKLEYYDTDTPDESAVSISDPTLVFYN